MCLHDGERYESFSSWTFEIELVIFLNHLNAKQIEIEKLTFLEAGNGKDNWTFRSTKIE